VEIIERTAPPRDGHGNAARASATGANQPRTASAEPRAEGHGHDQVRPEEARGQKRATRRIVPPIEANDRQHKQEQQQKHVLPLKMPIATGKNAVAPRRVGAEEPPRVEGIAFLKDHAHGQQDQVERVPEQVCRPISEQRERDEQKRFGRRCV